MSCTDTTEELCCGNVKCPVANCCVTDKGKCRVGGDDETGSGKCFSFLETSEKNSCDDESAKSILDWQTCSAAAYHSKQFDEFKGSGPVCNYDTVVTNQGCATDTDCTGYCEDDDDPTYAYTCKTDEQCVVLEKGSSCNNTSTAECVEDYFTSTKKPYGCFVANLVPEDGVATVGLSGTYNLKLNSCCKDDNGECSKQGTVSDCTNVCGGGGGNKCVCAIDQSTT